MKIKTRIFLGIFAIVSVGFYFLLDWIVDDLTPRYRESTEEPLVDAARILASVAATSAKDGEIDVMLFRRAFADVYSRSFNARIYDFVKTNVDFRVYITDAGGTVIFDSRGRDEGEDYSTWRDVNLTLQGEYGARTSHDEIATGSMAGVMYVAAPIVVDGETIGVLTVGKPTLSANQFIEGAKKKITIGGTITCLAVIVVGLLVSGMVTQPIRRLTAYANAVRDGERVTLPPLDKSEIRELGLAFEEMRDALEGKNYVEEYVQTLTHEVKSPLSAIRGAVELLREEMPAERRAQFLENIQGETDRIRSVVEKMLLLSSLENRKSIVEVEEIDLVAVLEEERQSMEPLLTKKRIAYETSGIASALIQGERFLIRHAVANLLQNAIEFTPEHGTIRTSIVREGSTVELLIEDTGPGIPEFALERIFDRFYSLKRPDTGRKSSGLGLSLVREVAQLHAGDVTLSNLPDGGVRARATFSSSGPAG